MKYKFIATMVISLLFVTALAARAEQVKSLKEGMKPYTPTRLEWLAVELNAMYRYEMNDLKGFMLTFIVLMDENTILIPVQHSMKTDRQAMNIGIDAVRYAVNKTAKSKGWDSWLKIKEEIKLIDPHDVYQQE